MKKQFLGFWNWDEKTVPGVLEPQGRLLTDRQL